MRGWFEINLVLGGGWPPDCLDGMSLEDFVRWYAIAAETHQRQQQGMK